MCLSLCIPMVPGTFAEAPRNFWDISEEYPMKKGTLVMHEAMVGAEIRNLREQVRR